MMEADDSQLLREFAEHRSDAAFAALVTRYVNLVYSVALRQTGNPQAAEEITQAVFIILARKAGGLGPKTILSGWLYQTARLTAANYRRTEYCRARREQEAHMQSILNQPEPEVWPQIAPLLDDALGRLGERDRHAIVLRYFENKTLVEVGAALGASEDAAKMRVTRALEKLRKLFSKRGVMLTATLIAGAVSANSVQAAPVGLAVTVAATAKGAAVSGSTLTLIKGALKLMAWTKAKTTILAGTIVVLAAGTATVTVKEIKAHNADDSWRVPNFDSRVLDKASPQVRILPAKYSRSGGWGSNGDNVMGIGTPVSALLMTAYHQSPARTVIAAELPPGLYDYIAKLPKGSRPQDVYAALQREVRREFGLIGRLETRNADVLLLKVKTANAQGLRPSANDAGGSSAGPNVGHYEQRNEPLRTLANRLEGYFERIPVIDRTGLTGNYDIDLAWDERDWRRHNPKGLKQALIDQLGLELVPSLEKIEMLVVERVKN